MISKPADNYLRAAHYLLYLLSLNGRAGQITRETNYLWVTIAARVELLQASGVAVAKSSATSLTCNISTLAAKTLFFDTLINLSFESVTKYLPNVF